MQKDKFLKLIDTLEGKTDAEMKELYADAFCSAMMNKDLNRYIEAKVLMHAACLVKSLRNAERDFNLNIAIAKSCLKSRPVCGTPPTTPAPLQRRGMDRNKKILPFPFPFNKRKSENADRRNAVSLVSGSRNHGSAAK